MLPKSKKNTGRPFRCSYGHGYYLHIGITNYFVLRFPSTVFWEKNGNGRVHNIESVTKLLKCNVFAQVIYEKIGNFLYFSIFSNMHPKFLIILEILTTKMAQKRAPKVQKIAEPRGFRSRILHCSA